MKFFFINVSTGNFLFEQVLSKDATRVFIEIALIYFKRNSSEEYSREDLFHLFSICNRPYQVYLSENLAASHDFTTKEIGQLIFSLLNSPSLNAAIPTYYRLKHYFPKLEEMNLNFPFKHFLHSLYPYGRKNVPSFLKKIKHMQHPIFYQSLLIGIIRDDDPSYLTAYDFHKDRLIWGFPLVADHLENPLLDERILVSNQRVPELNSLVYAREQSETLCIAFKNHPRIYLIDKETGGINIKRSYDLQASNHELFYSLSDLSSRLHVSSEGTVYHLADGKIGIAPSLFIGDIFSKHSLEIKNIPWVEPLPLSSHYGSLNPDPRERSLCIVSPTGHHVVIPECLSVQAKGNRLFTIEQFPEDRIERPDSVEKTRHVLNVRTLLNNQNVVSEIEQSIFFFAKQPSIAKICSNGQVVLFQDKRDESRFIFINLQDQTILFRKELKRAWIKKSYVTESGDIWSTNHEKLWRTSSQKFEEIDTMGVEVRLDPLHQDQEGNLYCS